MKKLLTILLVVALLAIGASAAETVLYQNDFSDPATLWDFTQYGKKWEVRDGGLYMTKDNLEAAPKGTNAGHILYNANTTMDNYVIDVDFMNVCSQSGVVVRSQVGKATHKTHAYAGSLAYSATKADQGALGAGTSEGWSGLFNGGSFSKHFYPDVDLHIQVIVKDQKIGVKFTNLESNVIVYDYVYTIGSNTKYDPIYTEGTFGFRMSEKAGEYVAAGHSYFDNLVVTTAYETVPQKTVNTATTASRIDTKDITPVYTNTFDSEADIADFMQLYGTWTVKDGQLFLVDVEDKASAMLIYAGDEALTTLSDYVLDVDMHNVQTQAGAIVRADLERIKASVEGNHDGNNFYGYIGYSAFAGNQAAIGYGAPNGSWGGLVDNCKSGVGIYKPTDSIHLQVAVQGTTVQLAVSDANGAPLWIGYKLHDFWEKGTFGFRMYAKLRDDGLDNVGTTSWDNLVISKFNSIPVKKTEIKMTIDSLTATVDGVAKTLDAAPIIRNSRTMLPVRFVAENLGGAVGWDDATKTVSVKSADTTIEIVIGANTAKVNGNVISLDSPAFIENSRTYLPVRVVAENLGATVAWDDATKTAILTK